MYFKIENSEHSIVKTEAKKSLTFWNPNVWLDGAIDLSVEAPSHQAIAVESMHAKEEKPSRGICELLTELTIKPPKLRGV